MSKKSRFIPKEDYFSIVQLEWLSYKTRELLYERPFDKEMYGNICCMKKEKIDTYSFRHGQKSIFNSESIADKYLKIFAGEPGIPNFEYKDAEYKEKIKPWDKHYFFKEGAEVIFNDQKYIVKRNICSANQIEIEIGGKPVKVYYCDCFRNVVDLLKENLK